jgi:sigma-B regulation protein RsbU (phosphoserine phosphatase)
VSAPGTPEAGPLHAGVLADLTVPARAGRLQLIRRTVDWAAGEAGFAQAGREALVLAVDEACQNVIRHGYGGDGDGPLRVRIDLERDTLAVRVIDAAPPVDPARVGPAPRRGLRPGGLGTRLMRDVLDGIGYEDTAAETGNVLRLTKRLEGDPA